MIESMLANVLRTCAILAMLGAGCASDARRVSDRPARPAAQPAAPADASLRSHPADDYGAKHLVFDDELDGGAGAAPRNHTESLWGDYVDSKGNAAVGWHSHDPATGNAR